MTLQNGMIHDGQAFVWTDTGWWTSEGKRALTAPKIITGMLFPWVASFSGASPSEEPYRIASLLGDCLALSPAGVIEAAQDILRREAADGRENRLLFAFPCARRGAQLWHVASDALPDRAPFEAVPVGKFVCWGAGEEWFAPYADRDITPSEMRAVIAAQLSGNASQMLALDHVEQPVSDVIETRVSNRGISHTRLRLIAGSMIEVPFEDELELKAA